MTFPQLRVRTEFSFRTTFGPVPVVADRLAEIGCKTAAIVDPGTWGHVRWEKALTKKEIQPAFGAEFNLVVGDHKPLAWCIAEELAPFYRFTSSEPKTPEAWLEAPKGVIRFCGAALTHPDSFDYIDLNPAAIRRSRNALTMAKWYGKKIILTGDNNFPALGDRNKFLAITDNKKITPQHILADKEEFRKAFFFLADDVFERAWSDTFEVAERLQGVKLRQAPLIKVPGDLSALVAAGQKYRLEKGHIKKWTKVYKERLAREMKMIAEKDFASYFIVVADLVCWAKERMLVGPARGSSAGSLVCYLLRITEVDPLVHGLLFERFIDINRNDLPDIDIDFNDQKRELCFTYLEETYGRANVARIGNINTLKPKSVMAEVGKRMGIPIAATFAVKNVLIEYSSGDSRYGKGLEDTLNNTQPGQDFAARYPEAAVMGDVENHAWHCASGEGRVLLSSGSAVKLKNLYKLFHGNCQKSKWMRKRFGTEIKLRAYDLKSDVLFFDDVEDVVCSGKKETLEFFVGGRSFRVTGDHLVYVEGGVWKRADEIAIGERVSANGICKVARDTKKFKKGEVPWNKGSKGLQVAWNKGTKAPAVSVRLKKNNPMARAETAAKVSEANTIHGRNSKHVREFLTANPLCEGCGRESKHLHHRDGDEKNNPKDGSNFSALCLSCHRLAHDDLTQRMRDWAKIKEQTIHFVPVREIRKFGVESVYDVKMKSKNHNFVYQHTVIHNCGVHAAGIIVSNEPVNEYCTVTSEGIAQLDKPDSEYLNLLKIDALGLRTLGIIEDSGCVSPEFLYGLALDDPEVFKIINEGKFSGVFQFEGAAQRRVSLQVPIDAFKKIDHVTALARPGPLGGGAAGHYIDRNAGRESIEYVHPSMAEYLGDTMGVVLYQEDIMKIVREIGKFSWEETSIIRKAMSGRKGKEFFDKLGEKFAKGAETTGLPPGAAKALWESLCNYGAWCLSGDTIIELPCSNQHTPKKITLRELAENNGYGKRSKQPSTQDKNRKAKIWCADEEFSVAKPVSLVRAFKSGRKVTFELRTESGKKLRATQEHQIRTPTGWQELKALQVGDEIICLGERGRNEHRRKIQWAVHEDDSWRFNARQPYDGRSKRFEEERQKLVEADPHCKDCGKPWDVCHHIDGDRKNNAPDNLVLLCNSHHKERHKKELGDKAPVAHSNGRVLVVEKIVFIGEAKEEDVYDIEMPAPNHNFAANEIIVHNCMNKSHTCSYAMISYWCCFMKRYHPLEYAAACLRNAKDDEQTIEILRELTTEGVEFTPFDPLLSDVNWAAKDGKLLGGYQNVVGIGPVKARNYVAKRDSGSGLTEKDLANIAKLSVKNTELRPAHALWGHIYADPEAHNIHGRVKEFGQLADGENSVVICKMLRKERRDENETVRLARRNGKRKEGETRFLDLFVVDDSVSKPIVMRVHARVWRGLGQPIADKAVDGVDWFLVRGKWLAQFSMMTVERIKCLTNPELFNGDA